MEFLLYLFTLEKILEIQIIYGNKYTINTVTTWVEVAHKNVNNQNMVLPWASSVFCLKFFGERLEKRPIKDRPSTQIHAAQTIRSSFRWDDLDSGAMKHVKTNESAKRQICRNRNQYLKEYR